jgi:hypothetical protein
VGQFHQVKKKKYSGLHGLGPRVDSGLSQESDSGIKIDFIIYLFRFLVGASKKLAIYFRVTLSAFWPTLSSREYRSTAIKSEIPLFSRYFKLHRTFPEPLADELPGRGSGALSHWPWRFCHEPLLSQDPWWCSDRLLEEGGAPVGVNIRPVGQQCEPNLEGRILFWLPPIVEYFIPLPLVVLYHGSDHLVPQNSGLLQALGKYGHKK